MSCSNSELKNRLDRTEVELHAEEQLSVHLQGRVEELADSLFNVKKLLSECDQEVQGHHRRSFPTSTINDVGMCPSWSGCPFKPIGWNTMGSFAYLMELYDGDPFTYLEVFGKTSNQEFGVLARVDCSLHDEIFGADGEEPSPEVQYDHIISGFRWCQDNHDIVPVGTGYFQSPNDEGELHLGDQFSGRVISIQSSDSQHHVVVRNPDTNASKVLVFQSVKFWYDYFDDWAYPSIEILGLASSPLSNDAILFCSIFCGGCAGGLGDDTYELLMIPWNDQLQQFGESHLVASFIR